MESLDFLNIWCFTYWPLNKLKLTSIKTTLKMREMRTQFERSCLSSG